jgi:hypothetical protein
MILDIETVNSFTTRYNRMWCYCIKRVYKLKLMNVRSATQESSFCTLELHIVFLISIIFTNSILYRVQSYIVVFSVLVVCLLYISAKMAFMFKVTNHYYYFIVIFIISAYTMSSDYLTTLVLKLDFYRSTKSFYLEILAQISFSGSCRMKWFDNIWARPQQIQFSFKVIWRWISVCLLTHKLMPELLSTHNNQ